MSRFVFTLAALSACTLPLALGEITPLVSYTPAEDVTEHSKIDLDVFDMKNLLSVQDYAGAISIYQNGRYSSKGGDVLRNLQGFSHSLRSKYDGLNEDREEDEHLLPEFELFSSYWGNDTYADEFVMGALEGTGDSAGLSDSARSQLAVKGVQYQVVWMYVLRELYEALKSCLDGDDPKPKAWDEGVAFHVGSFINEDGGNSNSGGLVYTLADKRCKYFNTCTNGREGIAKVNKDIMTAFNAGLVAVQAGECTDISKQLLIVRKLMQIPVLQGAMQYAYKSDPAVQGADKEGLDKAMAEVWAFAAAMLPFVDEMDSAAAELIQSNLKYTGSDATIVKDGYEEVFKAFYKVLPSMCISCEEIGVNDFEVADGFTVPQCVTDEAALETGCNEYLGGIESTTDTTLVVGLLVGSVVILIALGAGMWYMWNAPDETSEADAARQVEAHLA